MPIGAAKPEALRNDATQRCLTAVVGVEDGDGFWIFRHRVIEEVRERLTRIRRKFVIKGEHFFVCSLSVSHPIGEFPRLWRVAGLRDRRCWSAGFAGGTGFIVNDTLFCHLMSGKLSQGLC